MTSRVRARTSIVAAAALLAACTPTAQRPLPVPSPSPVVVRSLQEGMDALFANRYTVARSIFEEYVVAHPGSVEGHARYALLLNYSHQYPEAAREVGIALKLAPRDGLSRAIATRVADWSAPSGDHAALLAAVTSGRSAVDVAPTMVLAHDFYAEALADSGDVDSARTELDAASALKPTDAYERAETERERANLAGDMTDRAAQLQHLEAAREIQPGWVERTRELADYYFGVDRLDLASTLLNQAVALAPDDADLRITLGSTALLREDAPAAAAAFAAADRLRPGIAELMTLHGVTDYEVHHDTAATEALLRAAHDRSPGDASVAELLEGFLRYIKGDIGAASEVTVGRPAADPARAANATAVSVDDLRAAESTAALAAVNHYRAAAGLAPVTLDNRITSGAVSHAYWFLFNLGLPAAHGLGIHHEQAGTPGFTGFSMRDRASHFGYPPAAMSEDITHRGSPAGGVTDWVDSVFHRFPVMRADLVTLGFGEARVGSLPIEVMDMGYAAGTGDPSTIIPYPAAGQKDVPVAFYGNELPDPVPKGGTYPTGYPVTVNFNFSSAVAITSERVSGPDGAELPLYILQPTPAGTENVLSMLPRAPFKAKTTYSVHVAGLIGGVPFVRDWTFNTAAQ